MQAQMNSLPNEALNKTLQKSIDQKYVFGAIAMIKKGDETWISSAGELQAEQSYFIASTTKLYITALVFKFREEGRLSLDSYIEQYLSAEVKKDLHVIGAKDYTSKIQIRHLLSQTSGLPDYFLGKPKGAKSLMEELSTGNDKYWSYQDAIALSKTMTPSFEPGAKGKALYSDTNYQLLGKILEQISGETLEQLLAKYIFTPLKLNKTYLYKDKADSTPATMYFKHKALPIPMAMTSVWADGGIVSTAEESMIFIEAFFNGKLFPKEDLKEMEQWNKIFFPLQYGIGLMKFQLPRIFSPFKPMPILIGHSGLSGAFQYYVPEKNCFITGTVNQIDKPSLSYKLLLKLVTQVK
jgi:CubicO group peptidase (beta-lactamase class C family)